MGSGLSKIRHSKPHHKSYGNTSQANTGVDVHNRRNREPAALEAQFSGPEPLPHSPDTILGKPYEDVRLHYTIGRELGRGRFGITYLCTENSTGRSFACKSIAKRKLVSKTDRDDIKREVHIMQHLSGQPNIVELRGAYEDRHSVLIVMELCAGGELFDRIIAKGHYSERAAASVFGDIMNIVNVCHSKGVVHRDLKPENLLFSSNDENAIMKVTDFGFSFFFEEGKFSSYNLSLPALEERVESTQPIPLCLHLSRTLTKLHEKLSEGKVYREIVGSAYYVAPEVLQGKYGKEIDIWSAGVILYILLSGVPPFWASENIHFAPYMISFHFNTLYMFIIIKYSKCKYTITHLMTYLAEMEKGIFDAILQGNIDFESAPWPSISSDAKDLVRRVLTQDPKKRIAAAQVLEHPWLKESGKASNKPIDTAVIFRMKQFRAMNKLKKLALKVIVENLPTEEIQKLKEKFTEMDTDNSGTLTYEELKAGLAKLGSTLTGCDVKQYMQAADIDGNGTIDYIEFITATMEKYKLERFEHLYKAFQYFDKDNNGYITVDELETAFKEYNMGDDATIATIKEIMSEVD